MKKLDIERNFETWYELDYEISWINYVCIKENDNDNPDLFFFFYADYPIFEEKEKFCPLHKRRWIDKKIKYQKLKNEDIFNCQYLCIDSWSITMDDILEILKFYEKI